MLGVTNLRSQGWGGMEKCLLCMLAIKLSPKVRTRTEGSFRNMVYPFFNKSLREPGCVSEVQRGNRRELNVSLFPSIQVPCYLKAMPHPAKTQTHYFIRTFSRTFIVSKKWITCGKVNIFLRNAEQKVSAHVVGTRSWAQFLQPKEAARSTC